MRLNRFVLAMLVLATSLTLTTLVVAQASVPTINTFQHDPDVDVDVSLHGQARHIVADSFGRFIMVSVDAGPALVLSYSNDRAANWTAVPLSVGFNPNRPALAYDPLNNRLHMVYQVNGAVGLSGLTYHRFIINRDGANNITGFTSEGTLELDPFNTRRPTILWTPDGGPNGILVAAWSRTNDADTRLEIRVSMRNLSNDAADFVAANWRAPDGTSDTSPIALPNVAFNLVEGDNGTLVGDSGIACLAQRGGAGANARDVYVVYGMLTDAIDAWRWRKADWNAVNTNWSGSGDWSAATTVVAGNFGMGSDQKYLSLSCVYDDLNDRVWFSASRFASGQDIVSLYSIAPDDTTVAAGDVDAVGAPASRLRMTALGFDPITAGGEVWVLYITGDASAADGFVRYRAYRPSLGFSGAGDLYAVASNNYPNVLERRNGDLLLGMFRTNTSPFTLRRVTIQFPSTTLLYFSTRGNSTVPGVAGSPDDADIYGWNGASFSRLFDASAAGLPNDADIDSLRVSDADTFYVSFSRDGGTNVPGLGSVEDEDIVLYDAGVWSLYLDGSAVGLSDRKGEDVDAFELLPDGSVIVSTVSVASVPGVSEIQGEDLIRCVGSFGPTTTCTWSLYFDGSQVGLDSGGENVNGVAISDTGSIYLTTVGDFSVTGLSGSNEDVFVCNSPVRSNGIVTGCASFSMFFDGSANGFPDVLDAIDLP